MPKAPRTKVGQNKKVVHPNSRRAKEICRKAFREQKLEKTKSSATARLEILAEKLMWFQENINEEKKTFTKNELTEYAENYMRRYDDELEQISIVESVGNRQGHQHAARESALKLTMDAEKNEYEGAGIEVPDLINGKNLESFREWEGEIRFVANIKLRKISIRDSENKNSTDTQEKSEDTE